MLLFKTNIYILFNREEICISDSFCSVRDNGVYLLLRLLQEKKRMFMTFCSLLNNKCQSSKSKRKNRIKDEIVKIGQQMFIFQRNKMFKKSIEITLILQN